MIGDAQKETEGDAVLNTKPKYLYLEVMRIIAVFWVIFNHTAKDGFFLFSLRPVGSIQFWTYMFFSVFCKFAVPLFLMISGAVLLGKKPDGLKILYKKRILRMAVVLVVFSFAYYVQGIYLSDEVFSISSFLKKLYTSYMQSHLWYMYAYIAFLISLPFLQSLVANLETKYFYYLIGIVLIIKIIWVIEYRSCLGEITIYEKIEPLWLCTNIVLYPIIGYFLQNKVILRKKDLLILWISNIAGICTSCYMTNYKGLVTGVLKESQSQSFHNTFVLLNAICIFCTVKYIVNHIKLNKRQEKIIYTLGECTFGVFLLHMFIQVLPIRRYLIDTFISAHINYMVSCWLFCLFNMIVCFCITYVLRKIPIVKWLF